MLRSCLLLGAMRNTERRCKDTWDGAFDRFQTSRSISRQRLPKVILVTSTQDTGGALRTESIARKGLRTLRFFKKAPVR